jgi:hypothetical protein
MIGYLINERRIYMKKLLMIIVLLLTVFTLSACEEKPHEECIETWEFEMQERPIAIVFSYTAYVLTTEYGDVDVSKKIYESALAEEYSEICIIVYPEADNEFIGGTLIDGTPIEQDLVDEIFEQVTPDQYHDGTTE